MTKIRDRKMGFLLSGTGTISELYWKKYITVP